MENQERSVLDLLIENAFYPKESQLAFARKRPERALRDAHYNVQTRCNDFALKLDVNLNGSIAAHISRNSFSISSGRHERTAEWEPIRWVDSGNIAIIHTELGRDHIQQELSASEVVRHYLEAITTERTAFCQGGYGLWQVQMQLMVDTMAMRRNGQIELVVLPRQTTCPGMELVRPWRPPHMEATLIQGDDVKDIEFTEDELSALEEINARCRPRCSTLVLNPPFMIRNQYREIFLSNHH